LQAVTLILAPVGCKNPILLHMKRFRPGGVLVKPTAERALRLAVVDAKVKGETRSGIPGRVGRWEGEAAAGVPSAGRPGGGRRVNPRARVDKEQEGEDQEREESAKIRSARRLGWSACVLHARPITASFIGTVRLTA
jgi:hypothetical protein